MNSPFPLQPSAEDNALRRERLRELEQLLEAALGIELAAVMIAIYMGDMNEQEAAEALMIPANIVRSRRSRATKILSETPGLRNLLRGK